MNDIKYIKKTGKLGTEIYVANPNSNGYTAYFGDFPHIITEGDSLKDAQEHLWNTVHDILKNLPDLFKYTKH